MTSITPLLILKEEIPGLSDGDLNKPFDQLAMDSFVLVSLRARLEQFSGHEVSDEAWTSAETLSDLLAMFFADEQRTPQPGDAKTTRTFSLNMPQMAMGGLSELWLLKELGDMHWQMTMDGLQCPSSELTDGNGNRLYATFTRISVSINALCTYKEDTPLRLDGEISRFGSGMFFTDINITHGRAQIMSSFAMRGESGSNVSLLKGQPKILPNCKIGEHFSLPTFGQEYRALRASELSDSLFSCKYDIVPQHDINGVGLLYFAAYPIISDICESQFASLGNTSTTKRDVYYFSNCDPDETLVFRIHRRDLSAPLIHSETSLSRQSDGVLMARIFTAREVFPIAEILRRQLDYVRTWSGVRATPESFIVTLNNLGACQGLFWCLQGHHELVQFAKHLGPDQPVHGMRSGHLIMEYTDENVSAIASYYAEEMIALQPEGPFLLGGNCQGGVIARAIALRLHELGRAVSLLVLMEQESFALYDGPVALIFGRDSHSNPYKRNADTHAVFRGSYPAGFTVDLISGAHGQFFEAPNVQSLASAVNTRLADRR